jgi:hypothetical protein
MPGVARALIGKEKGGRMEGLAMRYRLRNEGRSRRLAQIVEIRIVGVMALSAID